MHVVERKVGGTTYFIGLGISLLILVYNTSFLYLNGDVVLFLIPFNMGHVHYICYVVLYVCSHICDTACMSKREKWRDDNNDNIMSLRG